MTRIPQGGTNAIAPMRIFIRPAILILGFFFPLFSVWSQDGIQFRYTYKKGDQWRLTSRVNEEIFIDGEFYYSSEILNKISAWILKDGEDGGRLKNRYQIAEKSGDVYTWSSEYEVEYNRDRFGKLSGFKRDSPVPAVRNMPVFPETELSPGESWTAEGTEVYNLKPTFSIDKILKISFPARYLYRGVVEKNGRTLNRFTVNYGYDWNPGPETQQFFMKYDLYPLAIKGKFQLDIFWDALAGRNYATEGQFSYTFSMNDNHDYTFKGKTEGRAFYTTPLNRKSIVAEVEKLVDNGIQAVSTDEGVSITLDNILFLPDQPVMVSGEEKKLDEISRILRRYPERDILIKGHSARIPGRGDGQVLSEKRAGEVARYLIENKVRDSSGVIVRGMGDSQPVGNNATEIGRRKNRRVEIIILEN